jgi:hypothetical protein
MRNVQTRAAGRFYNSRCGMLIIAHPTASLTTETFGMLSNYETVVEASRMIWKEKVLDATSSHSI